MEIQIYHDTNTLKKLRVRELERKKKFTKSVKKFFKKLDVRRFCNFQLYGKVLVITTLTVKRTLNIIEQIVPMTFCLISVVAEIMYRKTGLKELLRITRNSNVLRHF